ncbi:hypothetical protein D3C76_611060 [compost metagenome]
MVGDSFANHFTGMVDLLAKPDGITLMDYTMDSCPPILGYTGGMPTVYAAHCALRNARVFELIEQHHYPYVVLAGSWPRDEAAAGIVEASLRRVVENSGQVIVILSNQDIDKAATCPIRRLMFNGDRECSTREHELPRYWTSIRAKFPSLHFIDPNQVICPAHRCSPIINGNLLYLDNAHLNEVGSRYIGHTLLHRGYSLLHDPSART